MRLEVKLQIIAGIGAILSLPMIYIGLTAGGGSLALLGLGIFVASMLVTPVLKLLPYDFTEAEVE